MYSRLLFSLFLAMLLSIALADKAKFSKPRADTTIFSEATGNAMSGGTALFTGVTKNDGSIRR